MLILTTTYFDFNFDNFSASLDLSNCATNPDYRDNELIFTLRDGVTGEQNLGGFSVVADKQENSVFNFTTKCILNDDAINWGLDTALINAKFVG